MNQDWKQFTKTVTHELRDEHLSPKERAQLLSVAAMLSVTQENALPSKALLNRILKETSVTNPSTNRSLYGDEKKTGISFSTLSILLKNFFSQKKWVLASGTAALILVITLSFSEAEKTFVAEQSWFPKLETTSSNTDTLSLETTESSSEKTPPLEADSTNETSKVSQKQEENDSEESLDTLLALTLESEGTGLTFDEDAALQNMDQDINSLTQLYDENNF